MILNRNLEMPKILHFPGTINDLRDIVLDYTSDIVIDVPKNLKFDIVTCFTPNLNPDDLLLVKQLNYLNVPFVNAWDYVDDEIKKLESWKHIYKILGFRNYLRSEDRLSQEKPKKFAVFLDARDTIFISFDFLPPYKYYKSAKLLFNGGKSDFPNKYGKITIKSNYPVFLNAGACIGECEYAEKIFTNTLEFANKASDELLQSDDQAVLREIRQQEENHIRVDEECHIFQLVSKNNELVKIDNKIIIK